MANIEGSSRFSIGGVEVKKLLALDSPCSMMIISPALLELKDRLGREPSSEELIKVKSHLDGYKNLTSDEARDWFLDRLTEEEFLIMAFADFINRVNYYGADFYLEKMDLAEKYRGYLEHLGYSVDDLLVEQHKVKAAQDELNELTGRALRGDVEAEMELSKRLFGN